MIKSALGADIMMKGGHFRQEMHHRKHLFLYRCQFAIYIPLFKILVAITDNQCSASEYPSRVAFGEMDGYTNSGCFLTNLQTVHNDCHCDIVVKVLYQDKPLFKFIISNGNVLHASHCFSTHLHDPRVNFLELLKKRWDRN